MNAVSGVTANFIAPRARTRMTESMPNNSMFAKPDEGFDYFHPAWPAQLVLAPAAAARAPAIPDTGVGTQLAAIVPRVLRAPVRVEVAHR